jgi:hypothetical protein
MNQEDRDRVNAAIERDLELLRRGYPLASSGARQVKLPAWWYAAMCLPVVVVVAALLLA